MLSARSGRRTRRVALATGASAVLALGLATVGGVIAPADAAPSTLTGLSQPTPGSSYTAEKSMTGALAKSDPALLKLTGSTPTRVMVKLDYDALGSYLGHLKGLPATSPQVTHKPLDANSSASKSYLTHIKSMEKRFVGALSAAVPGSQVGRAYRAVYGGFAVKVPADKVSTLLSLPGVAAVQADSLHKLTAAPVDDDDASFIGAQAAYDALGSSATAGHGVIVADIDTGVWPEHPAFAARDDLTAPPPTADSHPRACNFGTNPLTGIPFTCNDKLIEGQVFLNTYNSINTDELYPTTARDSNGHGTHTTSTAAGNPEAHAELFGVDRGPITGIAPGAWVMSYKALGPKGGYNSDLVAAIEQAVLDGANVINYSIGPSAPQSAYTAADDLAFLDAFDAGVFVSASAGNSGPGASTGSHLGPWETTVGATTLQREFSSTASLSSSDSATLSISGSSIMPGISTPTPVVNASAAPYSDPLCGTPAPAGTFTGQIVVCVRGGNDSGGNPIGRAQKGFNVAHGGAAGMFLINPVVEDTETDNHYLPAVHFDAPAGNQLEAFLSSHPDVTATFTTGQKAVGQGDVMAAFSSRGPGGDFLKPDIAAPGVQILAGNTPTPTDVASGPAGQLYQAIAGTSMAAPHITGSAALVLALHPGMTPAEVKSMLMMTATRSVVKEDGSTPATPFDDGSGRVDLNGTPDPGLVLDVSQADMDAVLTDPLHRIDLNEPSVYDKALPGKVVTTRTFTNIDSKRASYRVSATSDLTGGVKVSPSVLNLPAHSSRTVTIALDATGATVGHWYFGSVELNQVIGGSNHLHLPVAFSPSDSSVSAAAVSVMSSCDPATVGLGANTTCTATAVNHSLQPTTASATMTWDKKLQLVTPGPGGTAAGQSVTFAPVELAAASPPTPTVAPGAGPSFTDISGITSLRALGDESIHNFTVDPYHYDGVSYSSIGVVSDGYLVVGGGDANDVSYLPQTMPNTARPNNVMAPLWTDLSDRTDTATPTQVAGQGYYIAEASVSGQPFLIIQWKAHPYGTVAQVENMQAWISLGATQQIYYTYSGVTDPGQPYNVGAENADGTGGSNVAGVPSTTLAVTSLPGAPGGSATFSATLQGAKLGIATVETDVTSPSMRDTAVTTTTVTVKHR